MKMTIQRTTQAEDGQDRSRALLDRLIARQLLQPERMAGGLERKDSRVSLRNLFEASEMSAHDFADEVADGFGLPRASLAEMMEAAALGAQEWESAA